MSLQKIGPVLILFVVLVAAAVLGYAWGVSGTEIVDTGLWQLHVSYQGIYVQSVADAYALDTNSSLAVERLSFICQQNNGLGLALDEAQNRYGSDPTKRANLDRLRELVASGQVQQNTAVGVCSKSPVGGTLGLLRIVAPVVLVLMGIGIVASGVLGVIRAGEAAPAAPAYTPPASVMPARPAAAPPTAPGAAPAGPVAPPAPGAPAPAAPPAPKPEEKRGGLGGLFGRKPDEPVTLETARSAAQAGAVLSAQVEKTDFAAMGGPPPLVQFMTTYLHGDDLYDDSFSIETPSGEFLGETGIGISETLGGGDSKNVAAFEIWLFDKNDIRTVTKLLMSDHAFNDEAIRARLAPKGEAVLARPGDRLTLETAALRVQARVVDFAYGSSPGSPPNSFFERVTVELAAWKREG